MIPLVDECIFYSFFLFPPRFDFPRLLYSFLAYSTLVKTDERHRGLLSLHWDTGVLDSELLGLSCGTASASFSASLARRKGFTRREINGIHCVMGIQVTLSKGCLATASDESEEG